jgi:hypothetical protein
MQYITFPAEGRFQPVRPIAKGGGGIVMFVDKKDGEPIEWIQPFGAETAPAENSATQTEGQPPASEAAPPPTIQVSYSVIDFQDAVVNGDPFFVIVLV